MKAPLAGLRIAVTRDRAHSEALAPALRALGAEPVLFPLIEIVPPEDWSQVDAAVAVISDYDWIIFTSANAVHFFMSRMCERGVLSAKVRLCAIGPATAQAMHTYGLAPELVPERHVAESLIAAMKATDGMNDARVLIPHGDHARDLIPCELRAAGARVDAVLCYRNIPARPDAAAFQRRLKGGKIDWILLFSPSAVHNLFDVLHGDWHSHTRLASIGPTTTRAILEHGARPAVEAETQTAESLLDAIVEHQRNKETHSHGRL